MARWQAPARAQRVPRPKATGVGSSRSEVIAAEEADNGVRYLEETTPRGGFTGILSRSRFRPPAPPLEAGHGEREGRIRPTYGDERDPAAAHTQFAPDDEEVDSEGMLGRRRDRGNLGADDVFLARRGILRYVRRRVPEPVAGTRIADPIRWGEPPIPRARFNLRYTLRREFEQYAQTFLGMHTRVEKRSSSSTSPVRMGPPRSNRLTYRDSVGSFGETTEVLNAT